MSTRDAFVTMAVLCREVRANPEGFLDLLGVVPDSIDIISEGEAGLRLMAVVRVYAEVAGEYPFHAAVLSPSRRLVAPPYVSTATFDAAKTSREVTFDLVVHPNEEGTYWFVVSVGPASVTKVPLVIRWTPDSRPPI